MGKSAGPARPSVRFGADSAPYGGQGRIAPLNSVDDLANPAPSASRNPDRPARLSAVARPAGRGGPSRAAGSGARRAGRGAPLSADDARRAALFGADEQLRRCGLGVGPRGLSLSADPSHDGGALARHSGPLAESVGRPDRLAEPARRLPGQPLSGRGEDGSASG